MNTVIMLRRMMKPGHADGEENRAQREIEGGRDAVFDDIKRCGGVHRLVQLLSGENNRADDGDQDKNGSDFKGQQVFGKERHADFFGAAAHKVSEFD